MLKGTPRKSCSPVGKDRKSQSGPWSDQPPCPSWATSSYKARLANGDSLTVAVLRDHFSTTRRYALDFLERLDALRITRRQGDERVLASGEWDRLLR